MIYVHVPFCRSFCIYCGFYSELTGKAFCGKGAPDSFGPYVEAVLQEIGRRHSEILQSSAVSVSEEADTLYFGGGTPSVLPVGDLSRIIHALQALYPEGHRFEEFTMEVNPEDIVEKGTDYVKALLDLGVDRISMGIQSFNDRILRWMNRRHNAERAVRAYDILREAGVGNVSIDLIFGLPLLDAETWQDSLDRAVALHPEHISAYQLSVDPDSTLGALADAGKFTEAPDEVCRRQYDQLCRSLAAAGYRHYEISNFSLPGREALHNSAYWRRVPYVGLGPGAHSYRLETGADGTVREIRQANGEGIPYTVEKEVLTPEDIKVETIMLGLRTANGVKKSYIYKQVPPEVVQTCLETGQLAEEGDRFRIPEDHFFVSDQIICGLI